MSEPFCGVGTRGCRCSLVLVANGVWVANADLLTLDLMSYLEYRDKHSVFFCLSEGTILEGTIF